MLLLFKHIYHIIFQIIFIACGFNLFCQEVSTVAEIYDYEVGDIFHQRIRYESDLGYFTHQYFNIEILDKYYSVKNDTLFYSRQVDFSEYVAYTNTWSYDNYIDTRIYTNLDSAIDYNFVQIESVYSDPDLYNGRVINFGDTAYGSREGYYYQVQYVVGCGRAYFEYEVLTPSYRTWEIHELLYYKKGQEEWGEPIYVSTQELSKSDLLVNIYPNPVSDYIYIDLDGTYSFPIECKIYDMFGRLVLKPLMFSNRKKRIDVSDLSPGIYYVLININDISTSKSLVIM